MGNVKNIGSQAKRLMMRERLRRAGTLAHDAPIGLRFEDEKIRKSGKQLKRWESFQCLLGGNVVGILERAALLLRESEILFGPGNELLVSDEAMKFHSVEARERSELIVLDEQKDFVGRSFAAVVCRQKNFRGIAGIAPTKVFVAKEGFELVVERSNFGASNLLGKGKYDVSSTDLRTEMAMLRRSAQVPRPKAISSP
jgi:hypothetical protein